jgi:hypothetical protein
MSSLFEKVEDPAWMQDDIKSEVEKERYKNKVKEYTSFQIGRKVSENTPNFTEKEIKGGNLNIKSSAILRIMTK